MLAKKVQNALDEARMLVLGTQVLLGFQYSAVFQKAFEKLPHTTQLLELLGLWLLLVSAGLLMSCGPFHQISRHSANDPGLLKYISVVVGLALLPLAVALSIDLYIAVEQVMGTAAGIVAALLTGASALFFWYALEVMHHRSDEAHQAEQASEGSPQMDDKKDKDQE